MVNTMHLEQRIMLSRGESIPSANLWCFWFVSLLFVCSELVQGWNAGPATFYVLIRIDVAQGDN